VSFTMDTSLKFGVVYSAHTTPDVAKNVTKLFRQALKSL